MASERLNLFDVGFIETQTRINKNRAPMTVTGGIWDYAKTDIIMTNVALTTITNVYVGAVGMIISSTDIALPANSRKTIDFDYSDIDTTSFYLYSFYYDGTYYNWSRVVYKNEA